VKAQEIWERIITELPVSQPDTARAYYYSAACYRKMSQYDKAIAYYEYVVDNWPGFNLMGNVDLIRNRGVSNGTREKSRLVNCLTGIVERL